MAVDLTRRYDAFCTHFGMQPCRTTGAVAYENGAIERAHGRLKAAISDTLLLRGARHFAELTAYRGFVDEVVGRHNADLAPPRCYRARQPAGPAIPAHHRHEEAVITITSLRLGLDTA